MRLDKRFFKYTLLPGTLLAVAIYVYIGYFCSEKTCGSGQKIPDGIARSVSHLENSRVLSGLSNNAQYISPGDELITDRNIAPRTEFPVDLLRREYPFDINGDQILIFLHIQKTGGTTFGRHLVDIQNSQCKEIQGKKQYDCSNADGNIWLFSRFSTGWGTTCGLHADWTMLQSCAEDSVENIERKTRQRRFYYISMLREPVLRYLSEWRHVTRGATWDTVRLECDGREATLNEVPFCYDSSDWKGVTLKEFYSCKYNLANDRQTRMLANLSKVGCYNRTSMPERDRNRILLQSALSNLKDLAYFGLTEYQRESQYLFERTFGLKFNSDFKQYDITKAKRSEHNLTAEDLSKLNQVNALDIQLYEFAKDLFFQRLKYARDHDPELTSHS